MTDQQPQPSPIVQAATGFRSQLERQEAQATGRMIEAYSRAYARLQREISLLVAEISPDDGGEIVWPEVLPENEQEAMAADGFDLANGLVSKRTLSQRRGYDYNEEQGRIADEKADEDSIGAMLLRAFDTGRQ